MVYFDHAASAPLCDEVVQTLALSYKEDFANPSSAHLLGRGVFHRVEEARRFFLDKMNGFGRYQLVFTSSATEANNLFILGQDWKNEDEVLFSKADHPSITGTVQSFVLKEKGVICKNQFEANAVGLKTKLAIFSVVNSQSGQIISAEVIREFKKKNPNVVVFADASQAFGKFSWMNDFLKNSLVDGLSISAHKMGGPKGVAGLFIKNGLQVKAHFFGGPQENHLRPGTVSAPLIFAFLKAYEISLKHHRLVDVVAHVTQLNLKLRELLSEIPDIEFPFSPPPETSPYILTFLLKPFSSDIILRHLEEKGLILSSTSACSSKIKGENPVLLALGLPVLKHKNVLRVSLAHEHTLDDIKLLASEIKKIREKLAKILA